MKIGILTYHRSHNYGALLQAIALRKVLADMGHEVTFIDYWPDYHKHMYDFFSWESLRDSENLKDALKYIKNIVLFPVSRRERIRNFNSFIEKNIVPYISSMKDSYDLVIHGSDQIWRKQPEIHTYNPVYFGKQQINTKRNISYAASMGVLPDKDADKQLLKNLLCHLDKISAREDSLKNLISELGYECRQDIDPTLLMTGNEWCDLLGIKKETTERYVLYYKLLSNSFDEKQILLFAKRHGLKLKILNSSVYRFGSDRDITTADPKQFLELVCNADFVFTSSFHGLVFSILFHKPFFCSFSKNASRAESVLHTCGIAERLLPPCSSIPDQVKEIDYSEVETKLKSLRSNSLNYLKEDEY